MAKPLQQDSEGNIINDTVTKENQKGYANYEADLKKRQEEMKAKDKESSTKDKQTGIISKGLKMLGMKSGGMVSSASKRADGCAVRGKTRA
jgi:regulatory protein YycH of two-component signal transduction system YycFG